MDKWRLMGFYGHLKTSRREETWILLESLSQVSTLPWLCIGDFNKITKDTKKKGGNMRPLRQMNRFRCVIHICGLFDLGFYGAPFTWFKNQSEESRCKIHLDPA